MVSSMAPAEHVSDPAISSPSPKKEKPPANFECLLCNSRYVWRDGLTKHNARRHCQEGQQLSRQLPCPECERKGMPLCVIESPVHWSNHTEQFHGKCYSPAPPSGCRKVTRMTHEQRYKLEKGQGRCLICGDVFNSGAGFLRHLTVHEEPGGEVRGVAGESQEAACQSCLRACSVSGKTDAKGAGS